MADNLARHLDDVFAAIGEDGHGWELSVAAADRLLDEDPTLLSNPGRTPDVTRKDDHE